MLLNKNKIFYWLLAANWIFLLFYFNSHPNEIIYFGEGLVKSINSLRILIPLISFLGLVIILIINLKKIFYVLVQKKNLIYFLFFLYFALQLLGLFFTSERRFTLNNTYLVILSFNSLITLFLINFLYERKFFKLNSFFIYTLLLFLFAIVTITISLIYKNVGLSGILVMYNFIDPNDIFFNQVLPRVTGLSRSLGLLNILLIAYTINKNLLHKKLYTFLICLISLIIFFIQSRGGILCFYSLVLIITIFQIKSFIPRIKLITLTFLIPILIHTFVINNNHVMNYLKKDLIEDKKVLLNSNMLKSLSIENKSNSIRSVENKIEGIDLSKSRVYSLKSTSGRIFLWKSAIENYEKNKIFGYGPQADRFLLGTGLEKSLGYGNNVSNAVIYSLISSGYFGMLTIILIYIWLIILLYNKFFIEKIFYKKNKFLEILSLYFIIFISIRSAFENGFAYFGLDFLLIISAIGACNWKNIYFKPSLKSK
jgi:hypothetical protein